MKKLILTFLSAMALLAGAQGAAAQTKVDASSVFGSEMFNFNPTPGSVVSKSGSTITASDQYKYYGWFNESWETIDLSDYSKLTVVISNYKGLQAAGIAIGANLCKTPDSLNGENTYTQSRNISKDGNVTLELDLETEAPYRAKVYYLYIMNWEPCSYTVKEFSLTKKAQSAALPTINADDVLETTYVSLTGLRSSKPFKGVNIVLQTLKNGSVKSFKMFSK